jgi:hypothetical protein
MFRKPTASNKMFSSGTQQKHSPIPIFQTNDTSVPVIRDVETSFTIGLAKKYQRSSGLEK